MFKFNSASKQIVFFYTFIVLVTIASVVVKSYQLTSIEHFNKDSEHLTNPSVEPSLRLLNGIEHFDAELKHWLNSVNSPVEDSFVQEQESIWKDNFSTYINELELLTVKDGNFEHQNALNIIKQSLIKLQNYKTEIAQIINSQKDTLLANKGDGNELANAFIRTKVDPLVLEIKSEIENIINDGNTRVEEYIQISDQLSYLKWLLIILISIGFITSIYSRLRFDRSIKTSIEDVINNIKRMAKGEQTLDFKKTELEQINRLSNSVTSLTNEALKRSALIQNHANKLTETANKDLAAQKTAMDQHSLVSVTDIKGVITYANDKFCAISGYSREELVGQNHRILNSGEQPRDYWRNMFTKVSQGEYWHDEVCNRAKAGHLYWVDTTIVPLYDIENKLYGFSSIRTDITHQKETISSLAEAKLQADLANKDLAAQKTAMDQHSLVSVTDIKGVITYANDKFCAISGYSRDELVGQNHRILNSGEQPRGYWRNMFTKVSQGEYWHDEVCNKAKDGHLYWVDTTIVPLYDLENKLSGFTSIRTDITHQKEIISRLAEAKKQADVSNESKAQFLANMSHEIRTPLNGVIGMTELLLETDLNIEQYNFAKVVRSSSESLITIINDILDFSKVEAGKMELELIEFDLAQLIYDAGSSFATQAEEHGIELICLGSLIEPYYFVADSGRIRQIISNLISNAIKFTEHGEVSIDCKLLESNNEYSRFLFEVSDTGIGISDDQQVSLFERFTQADESTTRKYGGTGLGLSICKQLVELMGGEIGVKDNADKGSVFWFTLNLSNSKNSLPIGTYDHLNGVKVLVADNNHTSRKLLGLLLTKWKVEYTLVEDSTEAFKELLSAEEDKKPYQVAILDMHMPIINGLDLGTIIKKDKRTSNINLVMLTSQSQQLNMKNTEKVGSNCYLSKPINNSSLYNALVKICSDKNENLVVTDKVKKSPQYNASVLVVEDNIINQKVAVGLLRKFGIKVFVAANGVEALATLEKIPVDLIFMDCQMPVMDGLEATIEIRNQNSKVLDHDVTIIALTANALDGDRDKCSEVGMNDFLSKPIDLKKLQVLLNSYLEEDVASFVS